MKKIGLLFLVLFSFILTGCSDDDTNEWTPPAELKNGCYVLNNGSLGNNDASLMFYNFDTKQNSNIFGASNAGKFLGETGQDMIIIQDKIYVSVNGSGVVYVTDLYGKIQKEIISKRGGEPQYPRSFAVSGDYVYVTYFDGYVGRINKNTLELDSKQVKVGDNPEEMGVSNGKLYVTNSGGMNFPVYNKTVSVVDLSTFTELKKIDVKDNPTKVQVDSRGSVYVISMGDYDLIPNTLQRIDPVTDKVDEIGNASVMKISNDGTKLYTIYAQVSTTSGATEILYRTYDTVEKKYLTNSFVDKDVTFAASITSLNTDPGGNFYIGTSDYKKTSTMYVISATTGKQTGSFNTGGITPMGAYFLK